MVIETKEQYSALLKSVQNKDVDIVVIGDDHRTHPVESSVVLASLRVDSEIYDIVFNHSESFSELSILDSAYWSFEQGLRYEPDNEILLELAAWNAGKINKLDDQFYYLDRLLEINPNNTQALERMSDTYRKNEMYETILYVSQK